MKTLSLTKLAIKDSAMECQSESFAQVNFIASDNVISISSIELQRESDSEKITSASCTSTDNTCSCAFDSDFAVGTYSITDIEGFFDYDLSQYIKLQISNTNTNCENIPYRSLNFSMCSHRNNQPELYTLLFEPSMFIIPIVCLKSPYIIHTLIEISSLV